MSDSLEDLRDRLAAIAEELAEHAIDRLRSAVEEGDADRVRVVDEERRITRARRAVEKAVHLLDGPPTD